MSEPEKTATPQSQSGGAQMRRPPEGIRSDKTDQSQSLQSFSLEATFARSAIKRNPGMRTHYEEVFRGLDASAVKPEIGKEDELNMLASAFGSATATTRSRSGLLLPVDVETKVADAGLVESAADVEQSGRRGPGEGEVAPVTKKEVLIGVLLAAFGMLLGLGVMVVGIVQLVNLEVWLPVTCASLFLSAVSWLFLFKAWQYRKSFYARSLGIMRDLELCSALLSRNTHLAIAEFEQQVVESTIASARLMRDHFFASGDEGRAVWLDKQIGRTLFLLDDAVSLAATGASGQG